MKAVSLIFILLGWLNFAYSQENSPSLLSSQPVLNQMIGNCYTHSGTDLLTGVYLKEKNLSSVVQPHPLLLGGIVAGELGRGDIESGFTCDMFNPAKENTTQVCSVQAFNRYVSSTGTTVLNLRNQVKNLEKNMGKLNDLFSEIHWSQSDKEEAIEAARGIIGATCSLNSIGDFDNPKFIQLVDDARELITDLSPRPVTLGSIFSGLADAIISGPGVFLARRMSERFSFSDDGQDAMNHILKTTYKEINSQCMAYTRRTNQPRVPGDFYAASTNYRCSQDNYMYPRRSGAFIKPKLDSIDRQIREGLPVGISVCSAIFYARFPNINGYRKTLGGCNNGGAHAITVTGIEYRNGKRFFKIRNSWGIDGCRGLERGKSQCAETGRSGCPTDRSITCENGVFYMSDDYLGLGLYAHTTLRTASPRVTPRNMYGR
mgnify:CR=1 FL=1